jgi:hypothetical protein
MDKDLMNILMQAIQALEKGDTGVEVINLSSNKGHICDNKNCVGCRAKEFIKPIINNVITDLAKDDSDLTRDIWRQFKSDNYSQVYDKDGRNELLCQAYEAEEVALRKATEVVGKYFVTKVLTRQVENANADKGIVSNFMDIIRRKVKDTD